MIFNPIQSWWKVTTSEEPPYTPPEGVVAMIGSNGYETLEAALSAAVSGDTVILIADATVGDITIPSGVTLVVPYDSTYSTGVQDYVVKTWGEPGSAYVTLAINGTATVDGTLLVNGVAAGGNYRHQGVLDGNYGHVTGSGSLNVNGTLYARGIIDGDLLVWANSGATVYQMFQVKDWRGGTVSSNMALRRFTFPFNEYEVSNIRAACTYAYGSTLIGQGYVYASETAYLVDIVLLGDSGMVVLGSEDAYCDTTYNSTKGQLNVATYGSVTINSASASAGGVGLVSSRFVCPISKHIGFIVSQGCSLTIAYDTKVLPGSYLTVAEGATLTISKNLYVYDADAYLAGFTYGADAATEDAVLTLDGTVTGNIYSSDSAMNNFACTTYTAADSGTTKVIREYVQNDGYKTVTFHLATLTAV